MLFFRQQRLSPLQHRAFASRFGRLHEHPIYPKVSDVPQIMVLDSHATNLVDNAVWHADVTFVPEPPLGAVLVARKLPPLGGDTLWVSGTAAYDALAPAVQQVLRGLTASPDFVKGFPLSRFGRSEADRALWERTRRDNPPITHPVVRTHPVSGREALFISNSFTTYIDELEPSASAALLAFLMGHATKPEFGIRWRWAEGDVAFWDNRATQHYAVDDYQPAQRIMHRATIIGDRPQ